MVWNNEIYFLCLNLTGDITYTVYADCIHCIYATQLKFASDFWSWDLVTYNPKKEVKMIAIYSCVCSFHLFIYLFIVCSFHLFRGKVYSSCVRSVMLHAAETWAMKVDTLNRLRRNDRAMIRWICNVRAKDEVSSDSLLTKLGIQDLDVVLRTSRMRWFGHVERSTGWIAEVRKLNVAAQKRSGRPRKSWDEVLENDRKKLGMDSADPQNRSEWRGRLRERLVKKPNPR